MERRQDGSGGGGGGLLRMRARAASRTVVISMKSRWRALVGVHFLLFLFFFCVDEKSFDFIKNIRQPVTDLRHCSGSRLISLRVGPQKAFHTVRLDVRGTRPDPEGPGARVP